MRSRIFNDYAKLPDDFHEHLETLWEISKEDRQKLITYVSEIDKATTTLKAKEIQNKAIQDIGGEPRQLLRAFRVLEFIYSSFNPARDTVMNFLKDLKDLKLIPKEKSDEAISFFTALLQEVEKDNMRRLEKTHTQALLPNFVGASALIDFRAVIKNHYMETEDMEIKDYKPECVGFVPIILLKINRSSGTPKTIEFQCEEEDLHILIKGLNAALKELQEAKSILLKREQKK